MIWLGCFGFDCFAVGLVGLLMLGWFRWVLTGFDFCCLGLRLGFAFRLLECVVILGMDLLICLVDYFGWILWFRFVMFTLVIWFALVFGLLGVLSWFICVGFVADFDWFGVVCFVFDLFVVFTFECLMFIV